MQRALQWAKTLVVDEEGSALPAGLADLTPGTSWLGINWKLEGIPDSGKKNGPLQLLVLRVAAPQHPPQ